MMMFMLLMMTMMTLVGGGGGSDSAGGGDGTLVEVERGWGGGVSSKTCSSLLATKTEMLACPCQWLGYRRLAVSKKRNLPHSCLCCLDSLSFGGAGLRW